MTTGGHNSAQQWNGSGTLLNYNEEQTEPNDSVVSNQSHQLYSSAGQSEPCSVAGMPNQPYLPTNQSGEFLSSFPFQPFTLIPPMVVPYTSLLSGSAPYSIIPPEAYMMPRIVDFSPNRNQMLPHLVGEHLTLPGFTVCQAAKSELVSGQSEPNINNLQDAAPDSTHDAIVTVGDTSVTTASNESNSNEKLPGIHKFLENLCHGLKDDAKDGKKETVMLDQRFVWERETEGVKKKWGKLKERKKERK